MAKSKKKKAPAKRPAARKAKATRKVAAKRSTSKKAARITKKAPKHPAKRPPKFSKSKRGSKNSRAPLNLLGRNNREKDLNSSTPAKKEKLLKFPNPLADSMAGLARKTFGP